MRRSRLLVSAIPVDWKSTLNLPKTEFPMRAIWPGASRNGWTAGSRSASYERILAAAQAAGRPGFVLHDGPPYSNGRIHYGTSSTRS